MSSIYFIDIHTDYGGPSVYLKWWELRGESYAAFCDIHDAAEAHPEHLRIMLF